MVLPALQIGHLAQMQQRQLQALLGFRLMPIDTPPARRDTTDSHRSGWERCRGYGR
ncbi:MAG: hypothetical protein M5R42_04320 [Rhodocyclaceae bacterium]|nr:hypothetical protein [Rhodocyclaceae bacterium]